MSHTFHVKKQLQVTELPADWFKHIDPELELDHIIDAKNIIKTIYDEENQRRETKSH